MVVVGAGTAGCVLAARLTENPDRNVCLLEAGPDYGLLADGRWPAEILDARALPLTHDWRPAGDDIRTLGGRLVGGSSAVNASMGLVGSPAAYDEWGPEWSFDRLRPHLDRAKGELRVATTYTEGPAPFHVAFLEAAQDVGFPLLGDPNDPLQAVGVAPCPANVVDGRRWNAALAYLEQARARANLVVAGDTTVDRVLLEGNRAIGVLTADGRTIEATTVVLTAGAYFSPAILMRSGIGPEPELRGHGISLVEELPVGKRLLDHFGTGVGWEPSKRLHAETVAHELEAPLFQPHSVLKAASSRCPEGSWDIHIVPWTNRAADPTGAPNAYEASAAFFHMKPLSTGRVRLRSTVPSDPPLVERGYFSREEDMQVLVEAVEIVRAVAAAEPLAHLLEVELRPGQVEPERYVRDTIRTYYHPAGTCPLGEVVDTAARVLGIEGIVVADASIMPTIPRANTNLTTAAVAERIATSLA